MSTNDDNIHHQAPDQAPCRQRQLARPSGLSPLASLFVDDQPRVFVPKSIVRCVGDAREGILLAQVVYWFRDSERHPGQRPRPRARYFDECEERWLQSSYRELSIQTGLATFQINRALSRLRQRDLIDTRFSYERKIRSLIIRPTPQMMPQPMTAERERGVTVFAGLVRMAKSANAALVLAQIVYWFGDGKDGTTRLRVLKNGFRYLAKRHEELAEETGLQLRQIRVALDRLRKMGLIAVNVHTFGGVRTCHIRLHTEAFCQAWRDQDDAWALTQVWTDDE